VSIIEKGYLQEFEECSATTEMKACWEYIYAGCQKIMANSMDLIYSETSAIIETLDSNLGNMKTAKEAEIASFSLRYIAIPRNCQKLLVTEDAKKLDQLKSVMTKCADICL
jgi:hypothetical protein